MQTEAPYESWSSLHPYHCLITDITRGLRKQSRPPIHIQNYVHITKTAIMFSNPKYSNNVHIKQRKHMFLFTLFNSESKQEPN